MVRAGIKALVPGGHLTGASTITQQACRNLLLSQERKLSRKIREWILTPRMERALTKDQILNLYLNQIYFGHNRYGVEEAALYYFGKHASALSVAEAAMLAGVVQQPERINPVTSMTRAKGRQSYVLGQMVKHGILPARERGRGGEGYGGARSAPRLRWGRTTSRRSAGCSSPGTATRWCSPAGCGWTSRWTRSFSRSPTPRSARDWRPWTGAWATRARWARSTPGASRSCGPCSRSASRTPAGAARRARSSRTSPAWPSRSRRRATRTRAPRSGRRPAPRVRPRQLGRGAGPGGADGPAPGRAPSRRLRHPGGRCEQGGDARLRRPLRVTSPSPPLPGHGRAGWASGRRRRRSSRTC